MQPARIHVRSATIADAKDIVRVHFVAVHGTPSQSYSSDVLNCWSAASDDERRLVATREAIERRDEVFVVAEIDGVIGGFGSIVPASAELRAVYVDNRFGHHGVGSEILRRLEEMAFDRGLSQLQMDASVNAEAFYVKHGYVVVRRGLHRLAGGIDMASVTMSKRITSR